MPGSFELPVVAQSMAKSGQYGAVVAIGVIVSHSCLPLVHAQCPCMPQQLQSKQTVSKTLHR